MIKSKTELFNAALTRLGERRINDANVTDSSAVVLRDIYQQCVDEVLTAYPWSCATSRAVLAHLDGDNFTGYENMFQIPADCLYVQSLLDAEEFIPIPDDYIREGQRLYCNLEHIAIKYTKRIEFYDMDTLVQTVLVLMLAYKSAYRITQDKDLEQDMLAQYMVAKNEAEFADGMEKVNRNRDDMDKGWLIP